MHLHNPDHYSTWAPQSLMYLSLETICRIIPVLQMENRGIEIVSHLPHITQAVHGRDDNLTLVS